MTITTDGRARAKELLNRCGPELYRAAYSAGMSLSAFLEREDPSSNYNDGLDAFQRLCMIADIRTASVPEEGVRASQFGAFDANAQTRSLVPEWMARVWRRAAYGRAAITSGDNALNTLNNPYVDAAGARTNRQIAPAIPLAELIAMTTSIDSDAYRAYYLTDDTAAQRMVRVEQATELPKTKLVGGDQMIRLYKYGRALEMSYESLRRMPIDKVAFHLGRIATQAETDKVATVVDVIVNGDGNSNGATSYNLTALDSSATAGTLSLKGWLAFKMKFANPYMATHALAQEAVALQMMMLNMGSANVPTAVYSNVFGAFQPINPGLSDAVRLGWTSDAPSLKIVALDSRFAVERVVEVGSNISEVEKWTLRQTETITMSEVEGYAIFDSGATKILDVNA